MAETLQQLLRTMADRDSIAVKHGDASWTWREHLSEASEQAAAMEARWQGVERCRPTEHRGIALRVRAFMTLTADLA
jgi:poly(3-hydroxybutyrate) depolymerase